jgi:HK97 family phage prohead protease
MTTIQHYTEVRDLTVKGRTIDLIAVPYDTPEWVSGPAGAYRESFARGAFAKFTRDDIAPRVHLRYEHQPGVPYGRAMQLREDTHYLRASMKVTRGLDADRLLAQVEDGDIRGVSIGFVPGRDSDDIDADGPLVRRLTVKHLEEISLTESPVYAEATVLAVRAERERGRAAAQAWIESIRRAIV